MPCTPASPTGSAGRRCGRGRGATLAGLLGQAERKNGWQLAEETGEAPAPRPAAPAGRGPAGTRTPCGTTCGPTWSSTSATRGRCWWWTRRASSRRGRGPSGCSGEQQRYNGAPGELPGRRLPGPRHPPGPGLPGPRPLSAPELGRRPPAAPVPGVPAVVRFATKPQLARAMLQRVFAAQVPAAWVVGDKAYGTGLGAGPRPWLEAERRAYVLAVPFKHRVWTGGPAGDGPRGGCPPARRGVGAPLGGGRQPGPALVRTGPGSRSRPRRAGLEALAAPPPPVSDPAEIAYYRVFAPVATPLEEAARAVRQPVGGGGGVRAGEGGGGARPVRGTPVGGLAPPRHPGPAGPRLPGGHPPRRSRPDRGHDEGARPPPPCSP